VSGLLITMGDSWTYGQGSSNGLSWGDYVSSALSYDFINLGIRGNSNSGAAKTLITKKHENLKEKYDDVIVIFLLTDPIRFSFYSNTHIRNFSISHNEDFFKWYVSEVVSVLQLDPMQETAFYLKCVENFCKLHTYKFYYAMAFNDVEDLNVVYRTDGLVMSKGSFRSILTQDDYAEDYHPNDNGYKKIAEYFLQRI